jgi:hypothetical protein
MFPFKEQKKNAENSNRPLIPTPTSIRLLLQCSGHMEREGPMDQMRTQEAQLPQGRTPEESGHSDLHDTILHTVRLFGSQDALGGKDKLHDSLGEKSLGRPKGTAGHGAHNRSKGSR